jgi:hypothetical protein
VVWTIVGLCGIAAWSPVAIRAIERLQKDEVDFVRNAARKALQALQPADKPPIR